MTDGEILRRLQGQTLVLMCAIRALIATHPDKKSFLSLLQQCFGQLQLSHAGAENPSLAAYEDAKLIYEGLCLDANSGVEGS